MPATRVRMTVAYHGAGFRGFAPNRGVRTVGGTLVDALERLLGHPVNLVCAGRTDAGVHAWGQVVSFDAFGEGLDLDRVRQALNRMCGPAIVVRAAGPASGGFDARRSAVARLYRYTVLNQRVPDPFAASTSWHVAAPLDAHALRLASRALLGVHDFSSFCRRPNGRALGDEQSTAVEAPTLVRRVLDARWRQLGGGLLHFEIEASAFCHQMVRSIVGTLVEVGVGRRRADELPEILRARDRAAAGQLAPAHGLCLWRVRYGQDPDSDQADVEGYGP